MACTSAWCLVEWYGCVDYSCVNPWMLSSADWKFRNHLLLRLKFEVSGRYDCAYRMFCITSLYHSHHSDLLWGNLSSTCMMCYYARHAWCVTMPMSFSAVICVSVRLSMPIFIMCTRPGLLRLLVFDLVLVNYSYGSGFTILEGGILILRRGLQAGQLARRTRVACRLCSLL